MRGTRTAESPRRFFRREARGSAPGAPRPTLAKTAGRRDPDQGSPAVHPGGATRAPAGPQTDPAGPQTQHQRSIAPAAHATSARLQTASIHGPPACCPRYEADAPEHGLWRLTPAFATSARSTSRLRSSVRLRSGKRLQSRLADPRPAPQAHAQVTAARSSHCGTLRSHAQGLPRGLGRLAAGPEIHWRSLSRDRPTAQVPHPSTARETFGGREPKGRRGRVGRQCGRLSRAPGASRCGRGSLAAPRGLVGILRAKIVFCSNL